MPTQARQHWPFGHALGHLCRKWLVQILQIAIPFRRTAGCMAMTLERSSSRIVVPAIPRPVHQETTCSQVQSCHDCHRRCSREDNCSGPHTQQSGCPSTPALPSWTWSLLLALAGFERDVPGGQSSQEHTFHKDPNQEVQRHDLQQTNNITIINNIYITYTYSKTS